MELWISLVGLGGVLLGAVTQGVLTRLQTSRSKRDELLSNAYSAFIDAVAGAAAEARTGGTRKAADWKTLVAAKYRLLYFAPTPVVAALAGFDRSPQVLGEPAADAAFGNLVKEMRRSLKMKPVEDRDLYRIMVGRDTAENSTTG